MTPTRTLTYVLTAVLVAVLLGTCLLRPTTRSLTTFYVSQLDGDDTRSCDAARQAVSPRRAINRGLACLHAGDTLVVGPGTYDELLVGQSGDSASCLSGDAATQPGCAPIPNGLDAAQKTTVRGAGVETVLSPVGRTLPGGGSAITLGDDVRFVHIEGFRVVKHAAAGSAGGIYAGNVQHVTITRNELDNGQVKGGLTSRFLTVTHNHIHHTGVDRCPTDEKPTPANCQHGMYICGTDHVITDNYVHDTSYYGIQVSCEAGGIARIRLERNRIEQNVGVGLRCAGEDCFVAANLLRGNGQGITLSGSGVVANNTLHGYFPQGWGDPTGIWVTYKDGSGFQMINNILTDQKSAFLALGNADNAPPDPAKVHHNLCEVGGNPGCTLLAQDDAIYTNAAAGDFTLKPDSPARGAGVPVPGLMGDVRGVAYPTPPDLGAASSGAAPAPPVDQEPPRVHLTTPTPEQVVFGASVGLDATASDNVAVVGVQFLLNGQPYHPEQCCAPYRDTLDTTTLGNGPHTLGAVARDAAGHQTTTQVQVRVDNPVPPTPPGGTVLACSGTLKGEALAFTCTRPRGR